MDIYKELLQKLKDRYIGYASTYRASIQPFKYESYYRDKSIQELDVEDPRIKESLIEHVGHLPITAVTLFPYLDDKEVDLGKTLEMLAIHDIGEIVLGDYMIFKKTEDNVIEERKKAYELLEGIYYETYEDVENQLSASGKFAKSVDKIVADIMEFALDPEITKKRYKVEACLEPGQIVVSKREKKMKYMLWNDFLKTFYEYLLEELNSYFMEK